MVQLCVFKNGIYFRKQQNCCSCVRKVKLEEIKSLIVNEDRVDINCVNEEGYTAFLLLVKQGQLGGFASSMENVQNTTHI